MYIDVYRHILYIIYINEHMYMYMHYRYIYIYIYIIIFIYLKGGLNQCIYILYQ